MCFSVAAALTESSLRCRSAPRRGRRSYIRPYSGTKGSSSPERGIHPPGEGTATLAPRRKSCRRGETCDVDAGAGLVGLLVGLLVGPVADRIATNAPRHDPLPRRVSRSPPLALATLRPPPLPRRRPP